MRDLEALGVPLRRYAEGAAIVWAPRWACVLVEEWLSTGAEFVVQIGRLSLSSSESDSFDDGPRVDGFTESLLKRIISYVSRHPEEVDFAEAATAALRLQGRRAVEKMLDDRKDMVVR